MARQHRAQQLKSYIIPQISLDAAAGFTWRQLSWLTDSEVFELRKVKEWWNTVQQDLVKKPLVMLVGCSQRWHISFEKQPSQQGGDGGCAQQAQDD